MNGETTISYDRFMPEQPSDSPFTLPSQQGQTAPDGIKATKTKERTESNEPERRVSQQVAEGR